MKKSFYNRREIHGVYRKTPYYPSAEDSGCSTGKTEALRYTGSLIKGIATMHKSNAIPVTQGINTNPKLHKGGIDNN